MSAATLIPSLPEEEYARRMRRADSPVPELWDLLDAVKDPEIPVVSLWEMGILQDIEVSGNLVRVTITPTYSGCPAMGQIAADIETALSHAGWAAVRIVQQLTPVWTTDWLDADARARLRADCSGGRG